MICIKESARGLPHQVRLSQTPMGTASEKSPKISKMIDEAFTLIALALATLLLGTLINLAASWLSPAAAPVEPLRTRREPASRTRPAAVAGTVAPAPRASATAAGWACAVRFDGPDQEHVVNGRTFSSGAAAATAVTAAVEAGAGPMARRCPRPPMRAPMCERPQAKRQRFSASGTRCGSSPAAGVCSTPSTLRRLCNHGQGPQP